MITSIGVSVVEIKKVLIKYVNEIAEEFRKKGVRLEKFDEDCGGISFQNDTCKSSLEFTISCYCSDYNVTFFVQYHYPSYNYYVIGDFGIQEKVDEKIKKMILTKYPLSHLQISVSSKEPRMPVLDSAKKIVEELYSAKTHFEKVRKSQAEKINKARKKVCRLAYKLAQKEASKINIEIC